MSQTTSEDKTRVAKRKRGRSGAGLRGTYLHAALDDIKWADSGVGETAGENTANHALSVVACVVDVTHSGIGFVYFV